MNKTKNTIAKSIFREYDIRGRVQPGELDENAITAIADAFSFYLRARLINKIVIGYDNRKVSPRFAELAAAVFVRAGFTVYELGMCITPAAYFAQHHLQAEGLMMITASHNPDGWCGCKLGDGYSKTLGPKEIQELYFLVSQNCGTHYPIDEGQLIPVDIRPVYLADIIARTPLPKLETPLRIAVDAGNGAAGIYAWELFQRLGCLTFQLNCDPDDSYPHYFPNPSELKARESLRAIVTHRGVQADFGVAFDGDGDRLGVIDEQGNDVWSDRILMLLARQMLNAAPGAKIVFDVKCTQGLFDEIEADGGVPIMWRTGHSHIKAKLHEEGAALAGERSGHIFINHGGHGYDDALFAAAKLCQIMAMAKATVEKRRQAASPPLQAPPTANPQLAKAHRLAMEAAARETASASADRPLPTITLSALLRDFPQYITSPEIKIDYPDAEKYELVGRLEQHFTEKYGAERVCTINGARVSFPEQEGWALVRASSNLPELVIVLESKTADGLAEIRDIFKAELAEFGVSRDWDNE